MAVHLYPMTLGPTPVFSPRSLLPAALAVALLASSCSADTSSEPEDATSPAAATASATPSDPAAAEPAAGECTPPGDVSDSLEISGDFGTPAELVSEVPVTTTEVQRSVLIEGEGEALPEGADVNVGVTIINGSSGDVVENHPIAPMTINQAALMGWAYQGISCSRVGERSVLVSPVADALEGNLEGSGFEDGETLVVVFDILGTPPGTLDQGDLLPKAEGEAQESPAGFPTVELDEAGKPTITIPESDAPTELSIATLITGEGEEVGAGDRVYVHYRGVIWRTGEEFDSSWSRGEPIDFVTTEVIGGFSEALVGQTVGSQVISVVPAAVDQGGYGPEQLQQMGYEADDVMVFVLDILGTASAD